MTQDPHSAAGERAKLLVLNDPQTPQIATDAIEQLREDMDRASNQLDVRMDTLQARLGVV